jgi:uncharacterized protein with PQ loop repeat
MSLFRKRPRSAQQKAQQAKMRIFLRLACCAWLIYYVIVPMLQPAPEGETMSPALRIAFVVFFIAATVLVLIYTLKEYLRNRKAGKYSADGYEDDEKM